MATPYDGYMNDYMRQQMMAAQQQPYWYATTSTTTPPDSEQYCEKERKPVRSNNNYVRDTRTMYIVNGEI